MESLRLSGHSQGAQSAGRLSNINPPEYTLKSGDYSRPSMSAKSEAVQRYSIYRVRDDRNLLHSKRSLFLALQPTDKSTHRLIVRSNKTTDTVNPKFSRFGNAANQPNSV